MSQLESATAWLLGGLSVLVIFITSAFPSAALPLLIAGTLADRYRFDVAGAGLRLEHFVFVGVALGWLWRVRPSLKLLAFNRADVLLVVYLIVAFAASWLSAPSLSESLKFLALMAFGVVLFWFVRVIVATGAREFERAVVSLMVIGTAAMLYGIVAWLLYPFGINLGVQTYVLQNFETWSPYGTLWDANTFGIFAMALALVLMTLWFDAQFASQRVWLSVGIVIALVAMALSLTRTAWIGLGAGVLLLVLISPQRRWAIALGGAALLLVALALVVNSALAGADVSAGSWERLLTSQSIFFRLDGYARAWNDWLDNPWLGNGVNVFAQKYTAYAGQRDWISNFVLMTLHDTGIVGFSLLVGWLAWLGYTIVRALRAARPGRVKTFVLALSLAYAALWVAYQGTTLFWLGWNWVFLGLLAGGVIVLKAEGRSDTSSRKTMNES